MDAVLTLIQIGRSCPDVRYLDRLFKEVLAASPDEAKAVPPDTPVDRREAIRTFKVSVTALTSFAEMPQLLTGIHAFNAIFEISSASREGGISSRVVIQSLLFNALSTSKTPLTS
jgi:hypothetical protein